MHGDAWRYMEMHGDAWKGSAQAGRQIHIRTRVQVWTHAHAGMSADAIESARGGRVHLCMFAFSTPVGEHIIEADDVPPLRI